MRIIAHMVVGPGEADRYLEQVLDRVQTWADALFVGIDPVAGPDEVGLAQAYADAWTVMHRTWEDHEGFFRQEAWFHMEHALMPEHDDFIVLIDADEVVHEYQMVRQAAKDYPGQRLAFTFHEMWSEDHYRVDGHWKPYDAWVMIPYRKGAAFRDRALACGREPSYAHLVPKVGSPIARMLHYGYARSEDRQAKYERYMKLDGGQYHNPNHLKSILMTPSLEPWKRGGLINVRKEETD